MRVQKFHRYICAQTSADLLKNNLGVIGRHNTGSVVTHSTTVCCVTAEVDHISQVAKDKQLMEELQDAFMKSC